PGAGKTTLLRELAALGYVTVEESARAIIAERLARGESRRPDPLTFAREILARDTEKYVSRSHAAKWGFYDRGVIEALGIIQEVSLLPAQELASMPDVYAFHRSVFVLPPWEAIYTTDSERDQSFVDAVNVHAKIVRWYNSCGYVLHEVPCLPSQQRAQYVLQVLAESSVD